jgi:hypothetical protein
MNDETRWEKAADRVTEGSMETPGSTPEERAMAEAAAALTRGLVRPEPAPERLRKRLREDADRFVAGTRRDDSRAARASEIPRRGPWWESWFPVQAWGWQAATVLAVAVAVGAWIRPVGFLGRSPNLPELRSALIQQAKDVAQANFVPGFDRYAQLTGDVVWSTRLQDGFLRLQGLPANDPTVTQYQLWIVDPERDAQFPVDGGVFDVPSGGGEALVRFSPRLPISKPTVFVITRERPGGVVKSQNAKPVAVATL